MGISKNNKDKISFEKRQFSTAPLSKVMPNVMKSLGGAAQAKRSASMIRLITHWADIVGEEIALKSTPLKIIYKKQKDRQTGELSQIMVLKIRCEGALGTVIAMRQAVITDRLNRLFGTDQFAAITIEHGPAMNHYTPGKKQAETKHYDIDLPNIEDPVLKSRLESLGQAVMNSASK